MKVYRAIEFSKLIWMISDDGSLYWNQAHFSHINQTGNRGSNWWLNLDLKNYRDIVISDVIYKGQDIFFDKSLEFNAMQGGRFNPPRSFGMLYTSSNTLMSCLEVLFHQFENAYPLYKRMDNNSTLLTSSFNMNVPRDLDISIVVFEIEIEHTLCQREICGDVEVLKEDCRKIGFERYIGDKFNRNFIFGNDYEISRILGCHLHSETDPSYKVPSARVDFELQDELGIRNYLIPERRYNVEEIKLTGKYIEYNAKINLEQTDKHSHDVRLEIMGSSTQSIVFSLQSVPSKMKPNDQIIKFEPNLNDGNDRKRFFRGVETQRFF